MLEWLGFVDRNGTPQRKPYIDITEDDYCLIFNYTLCTIALYKTIEIRNLDKFCFIHNNCTGEHIIVSHDANFDLLDYDDYYPVVFDGDKLILTREDENLENMLRRNLNMINHIMYKDPKNKINQKMEVFEDIAMVSDIIIMGWSLGGCDVPYMDKVLESTRDDIKITVVYYDENDGTISNFRRYFETTSFPIGNVSYVSWD